MSKLRKYVLATALLVVLCANGTAVAAPRDDRGSDLFSRITNRIVRILEDLRMGGPPG